MSGISSFADALDLVLNHTSRVRVPDSEIVGLLDSPSRVLAEDMIADRDQPPFDRATRDGFAVQAHAWSGTTKLHVAGQVRAGETWPGGDLNRHDAIEIMTGAPVPTGADAVVMVEHVQQSAGQVWSATGRPLSTGENIVPCGSEAKQGHALVAAGTVISAAEIALAAACGQSELAVHKRPKVAIVATGDELVDLEQTPQQHQIRNSNTYALAAMVFAAGGHAARLEIARDTRLDLRERIAQGRMSDLLLLSGGVSAGKFDLVEQVLTEFGAEFFFTGVQMQPGKPLVFGRLPKLEHASGAGPECYFFGLPGNPISTQVTFHCFVEPMLRAMCGAAAAQPKFVQATLAQDVQTKSGLTRLLPALLRHDLNCPEIQLVAWQGSGDLAANARANCYAVLPDGQDLRAGDVITVLLR